MPREGMTLDRLALLLDAYGARPERWPDAEREAMQALLERSAEARIRLDEAAALDLLLEHAAPAPPSAALAERILAGRPRAKLVPFPVPPRRRARLVAAIGLAAAASLAAWLVRRPAEYPRLEPAALAQLGEYQTPTDALLSAADLDADDTMPEFGCDDPDVDCDEPDLSPRPSSMGPTARKEIPA